MPSGWSSVVVEGGHKASLPPSVCPSPRSLSKAVPDAKAVAWGEAPQRSESVTIKPAEYWGQDSGTIEVLGEHGLTRDQLALVAQLREAVGCRRLWLQLVHESSLDNLKVLTMMPEGQQRRARLPTVLRVETREAAEAELKGTNRAAEGLFRGFGPAVVDSKFSERWGLLQLELAPGRCALPLHVRSCFGIAPLQRLFEDVADGLVDPDRASKVVLAASHQVFGVTLLQCTMKSAQVDSLNLFQLFGNVDKFVLNVEDSPFGPSYYDGWGAAQLGTEEVYGSLVSDGTRPPEIAKLVQEASGRQVRPSEFFADFQRRMLDSPSFWKMSCLRGPAHNSLDFESVLHDEEGRAWLVGFGKLRQEQHTFCDAAHFLACGLFLSVPLEQSQKDTRHQRELIYAIASVPEDLDQSLPGLPNEVSAHSRFLWTFAQRMLRYFTEFSASPASAADPRRRAQKPGLQLIWALLARAVEMVASVKNRDFPERKRYALFAALAFATRLQVAMGKLPEPRWLGQFRARWRPLDDWPTAADGAYVPGLYLEQVGASEAWGLNPLTEEKYCLLDDNVTLCGGVEEIQGFAAISDFLEAQRRVLVVGSPGAGKTLLSHGLLAYAAQAALERGTTERLPLRAPVSSLAALAAEDSADLLQDLAARNQSDAITGALSWEAVDAVPWPARAGHQTLVHGGRVLVLGGLDARGAALQDAWATEEGGLGWEELPPPPWCGRHGHQAVVFEDKVIMLAGINGDDRRMRDAWESHDGGRSWQELPCPRWPARHRHQAVVLPFSTDGGPPRDNLLILGGNGTADKALRDAWSSDNGGFTWHELEPPPWPARYGHQALVFRKRLVVLGGSGEGGRKLRDVWVLSGQLWAEVRGAMDPKPKIPLEPMSWQQQQEPPWPARDGHAALVFRGQMVVFGGAAAGEEAPALWDAWASADAQTWRPLPTSAWLPAGGRHEHQVATCEGRHFVSGGLRNGRVLRQNLWARQLLLVLDGLEEAGAERGQIMEYLGRLLESEPFHCLLVTAQPSAVDAALRSHVEQWGYEELLVKPLGEADLRQLCVARLGELEPARLQRIEAALIRPQHRELVGSPLIATMVLRALLEAGGEDLCRCDLYQLAFEHSLQSHSDDSSRPGLGDTGRLRALGVDGAACELAFELQSRSTRAFTQRIAANLASSEAMDTLVSMGQGGRLALLFESCEDGMQFRHVSVQEFLAARHLWKRLGQGGQLPAWLLKEAGGNEAALGCGRFFCLLAVGPAGPGAAALQQADRFAELQEGLGSILRNMSRVGDCLAVRSLLGTVPNLQALLFAADTSRQCSTSLHLAAMHGHSAVARALLELAPNPGALAAAADSEGLTALHCAAQAGHEDTCCVLLDNVPSKWSALFATDRSDQGLTALHLAARHGHSPVCHVLLAAAPCAAELNGATDGSGLTALHLAAQNGHDQVARALLSLTPYPGLLLATANRYDVRTSLHLAAEAGEHVVVRTLLELAPEPAERSRLLTAGDSLGQTALHLAADGGHEVAVRALLSLTPDAEALRALLSARERLTGQTALHLAADSGHASTVSALLEFAPSRADMVRAVDRCGHYTALHLAAEKGRVAAVRALLQLAPDRTALLTMGESCAGQLALHLAAGAGHEEVVRELLELAPDRGALLAKVEGTGGLSALHMAAERGHRHVAQAVLELAPDRGALLALVVVRWCGFSALHLAAYKGHEATAAVLLDLAPDRRGLLTQRDSRGRTASQLAADRGHQTVAALLLPPA